MVILPTITSPECQRDAEQYHLFNDFCGFLSVAVNIMDKLQFLVFNFCCFIAKIV